MRKLATYATAGVLALLTTTACNSEPERDDAGAIVEEAELDAFSIKIGDCIEAPEAEVETSVVKASPCSDPHQSEAYHLFNIPGDEYPGAESLSDTAGTGCLEAFEPFVGLDYNSSRYDITWLEPTTESWAQGDREVVCLVVDVNGELLTGSAAGTAE